MFASQDLVSTKGLLLHGTQKTERGVARETGFIQTSVPLFTYRDRLNASCLSYKFLAFSPTIKGGHMVDVAKAWE